MKKKCRKDLRKNLNKKKCVNLRTFLRKLKKYGEKNLKDLRKNLRKNIFHVNLRTKFLMNIIFSSRFTTKHIVIHVKKKNSSEKIFFTKLNIK